MVFKQAILGAFASGLVASLACGCTVTTAPGNTSDAGTSTPGNGSAQPDAGANTSTTLSEAPDNDDFAKAQVVAPGSTINGRWEKPADQDFYSVTIPAGQDGYLQVTVTETDTNALPHGQIYKSDRSQIHSTSAADTTTNPFSFKLNVSAGKQYFVMLEDNAGSPTAIIEYTVKFEFVPVADTFERNDDFTDAKPVTAGTPFDLVLFAGVETNEATDVDFFALDVPAGKTKLHLEVTNNSTAEEPQYHHVSLYDADKAQQGSVSGANERANLTHDFNLPAGSKVYLRFDDNNNKNSATPSKVKVTFL